MARNPEPYYYTAEELAREAGWPVNRVHQDVTRHDLQLGRVAEAAVWLAANGAPELRARMAKRLIPVVLGTKERRPGSNQALSNIIGSDLMLIIFQEDAGKRKKRSRSISRTKIKRS